MRARAWRNSYARAGYSTLQLSLAGNTAYFRHGQRQAARGEPL